MSDTLIYVGSHTITSGKADVARQAARNMVSHLESNHSRMAHFEIGIDERDSEMTVIQVHPDEQSLATHLRLAREQIAQAYEFLEGTTRIDIYGSPSEAMVNQIREMAMGAPVAFHEPTARFSRVDG